MTNAPKRDSLMSADDNRRMFDRISRRYDTLNRILSLGQDGRWRRRAVRALAPQAGQRFLDIGCGTGDLAIEILRQSPQSRVVGIDLAAEMLKIAAGKIAKAGLASRMELLPGDAAALDFPDASFDGIVSGFCIRNVTDRLGAFREMARALRPGGRAAVLELTRPSSGLVRFGHRLYSRRLVPLLGGLLSSPDAYKYLVESIEAFPRPEGIVEMMRQAGFEQARYQPLTGGVVCLFTGQKQVAKVGRLYA